MRERSAMLASVAFSLILGTGLFVQSTRTARSADDCLAKPNAAAPRGQHWYYRIDHQNNRQCWRLGPEGLPVQKIDLQTLKSKQQTTAAPASTRGPKPATAEAPDAPAEPAGKKVGATTGVGWRDMPKFADIPALSLLTQQQARAEDPQSTGPTDPTPAAGNQVVASAGDSLPLETKQAEEPQDSVTVAPESMEPVEAVAETDYKFTWLVAGLVFLVIAGPIVHFLERRRQRAAKSLQPPQWAPLSAPPPAVRLAPAPVVRLAPAPEVGHEAASPDQSERLAQALHQLLDRLQTDLGLEQSTLNSVQRPEIRMKSSR
jgi:hypothetical protein